MYVAHAKVNSGPMTLAIFICYLGHFNAEVFSPGNYSFWMNKRDDVFLFNLSRQKYQ